jgi:hypothetical protein
MKKIDFDKVTPYFVNGNIKWYIDAHFTDYLHDTQANNLPKLQKLGCFVVKGEDFEDYVLIDNKQNAIAAYPYSESGADQMLAKINIIKISKHFDDYEKSNI